MPSSFCASASRQWGPPRCCCRTASSVSSKTTAGLMSLAALRQSVAAAGVAALVTLGHPLVSQAHIAIEQLPQPQQQARVQQVIPGATAGFDPSAVGQIRAKRPTGNAPSSRSSRQQSVSATEALEALQQLKAAEGLLQQGEYAAALQQYTALVQQHPDLALTEYARLGQAICMYQENLTSQALTQLNELELDIRGNPETHAALAAVLYAERPAQRWRAEQQWDIAVGFDSRYQDTAWVQQNKHWPPKLLAALEKFLSLR